MKQNNYRMNLSLMKTKLIMWEKAETRSCLFIYFLRDYGMWLRVGDIVSTCGVQLPLIISKIFFWWMVVFLLN